MMRRPRKRTMRRLKRVLGVSAIILAILIAAIPDMGEAKSGNAAKLTLEYGSGVSLPGDCQDVRLNDPASGEALDSQSRLLGNIYSNDGSLTLRNDDQFKLTLTNTSHSGTTTGYETEVDVFDFSIQWVNTSTGGNDSPPTTYTLNGSEKFSLDLKFDYMFPQGTESYYMAAYMGNSDSTCSYGEKNLSAPHTFNYGRSGRQTLTVSLDGSTAVTPDFSVVVYINRNPEEFINVDDQRGLDASKYSVTGDGSADNYKLPLLNIDRSEGVKSMHLLSAEHGYSLELTQGSSLTSTHEGYDVDLMDAFDIYIAGGSYRSSTFIEDFNDYKMYFKYPVSDDGRYDRFEPGNNDRLVMYYKDSDGNLNYRDITDYQTSSSGDITFSQTFEAKVSSVAFYIVRGASDLIGVDKRAGNYNNAIEASFESSDAAKTAALSRNVYVVLTEEDVNSGSLSTARSNIESQLSLGSNYTTKAFAFALGTYSDSAGRTAVTSFWDSPQSGWDRKISLKIGIPDSMDVSAQSARIGIYKKTASGWSTNPTYVNAVVSSKSSSYIIPLTYDPDDSYGDEFIVFYYALTDQTTGGRIENGASQDYRSRANGKGTATITADRIDTSGTYHLVASDITDAAELSLIQGVVSGRVSDLSRYRTSYIDLKLYDTNNAAPSDYSKFVNMKVTLTMPAAWGNLNDHELRVFTEDGEIGRPDIEIAQDGSVVTFPMSHFSPVGVIYEEDDGSSGSIDNSLNTDSRSSGIGTAQLSASAVNTSGTFYIKVSDAAAGNMSAIDALAVSALGSALTNFNVHRVNIELWKHDSTGDRQVVSGWSSFTGMQVSLSTPWSDLTGVRVFNEDGEKTVSSRSGSVVTFGVEHFSNYLIVTPTGSSGGTGGGTTGGGTTGGSTGGTTGGGGTTGSSGSSNVKFRVDDYYAYSYGKGKDGKGTTGTTSLEGDGWVLFMSDKMINEPPYDYIDETTGATVSYDSGDPTANDTATPEVLADLLKKGGVKVNKQQAFYVELRNGDNRASNYTLSDKNITLSLPVPESFNYKTGDIVKLYGLNTKDTDNPKYREIKTGSVTVDSTTGIATISVTLEEADTNDFKYINPYMLVSGSTSSSGSSETTSDIKSNIVVDTPQSEKNELVPSGTTNAVDLWSLGEPVASTTDETEDVSWRLLISQYTTPKQTSIGQAIINNVKNEESKYRYKKSRSTIKAYDIRLKKTDAGGNVSYPSTAEELEDATITITLPLHATLAKNGGNAVVYAMRGAVLEKKVVVDSVATGGTVTFTTTHFSQYAILYNAGSSSSSSGGSSGGGSDDNTGGSSDNGGGSVDSGNDDGGGNNAEAAAPTTTDTGTTDQGGSTGGGGNTAGGDSTVDMPRTADATTYKAIFVLILLAFGAFMLISSLPAGKKARA